MHNIESLNKVELELLLKNLRFYKDVVKKLGNRGKKVYDHVFNGKNEYVVEYYGDLDKEYVLKESKGIYKKVFNIEVNDKEIKLIKNEKVKGGMKIYLNDNLIDLSFLKFYNLLNK